VTALEAALAGEHAAIFAYGPVGAHLDGALAAQARAAEAAHRASRDALLVRLSAAGGTPPGAQPYTLPFPVRDRAGALRLAVQVEERMAGLWRAALRETSDADRRLALDGLTDSAVRATRWRRAAGTAPATVAFPGAPT
jgi:hypothetical protein